MGGGGEQIVPNRYTENLTTKTMKHTTITTMAALLLGCTGLYAQGGAATVAYTKPAGFVTHTLKAGKFNLIGLTLHSPIAISGSFEAVNGTTLTDSDVDFTSVLTAGKTYILEITENPADPSMVGAIQEITSWTATTLTTPQNLGADGLAGETANGANNGAKYQLRAASTLASLFGVSNSSDLPASASAAGSAIIWVQSVAVQGQFDKYYYNTGGFGQAPTWKKLNADNSESDVLAEDVVVPYVDAIFIQMPNGISDQTVVFTGSVKTVATSLAINSSFNYVSSGFPLGSTLQNSGLSEAIAKSASAAGSDIVWLQQTDGTYKRYYYNSGGFGVAAAWKEIASDGTESNVTVDVPIESAIIIQKNGDDVSVTITPGYNL